MTCKKCGSRIFLVDETITHLEINGEIVKELGSGDLHNRNCLRCTHPEIYQDYVQLDERMTDLSKAGLADPQVRPTRWS
jgi:predicted nucleic-acid-binding Zn-ribbon protein